jgi:RimJ/RimL family protein N-acetyltransferase
MLSDGVVRLRAWEPGDAQAVLAACQDPAIQRFTRVPVPYRREHDDEFIALAAREWRTGAAAPFAVTDVTGRRLWGACGLHNVDRPGGSAEVGYWVTPAARGRGVTTAALRLITEWAFGAGGLRRVYAKVEQANLASIAVARAAGYERAPGVVELIELKGRTRPYAEYRRTRPA